MAELPIKTIFLREYFNFVRYHELEISRSLIDTGSTASLISKRFLIANNSKLTILPLTEKILLTNVLSMNEDLAIRGTLIANVYIENPTGKPIELQNILFYVLPDLRDYDCLLGMNALSRLTLNLWPCPVITCNKIQLVEAPVTQVNTLDDVNNFSRFSLSAAESKLVLPGVSEFLKIDYDDTALGYLEEKGKNIIPNKKLSNNFVLLSKFDERSGNLLKVTNKSGNPMLIPKNANLGTLRDFDEQIIDEKEIKIFHSVNFLVEKKYLSEIDKKVLESDILLWRKHREELVAKISLDSQIDAVISRIPQEYQSELRSILYKYNFIFSRSTDDAGLSHSLVCELKLEGSEKPTYVPPYRMASEQARVMQEKIQELLKNGIISEGLSAFNSPALLVKKRNGKYRFVTNFSKTINRQLQIPSFPIANVRKLFKDLSFAISGLKRKYPNEKICFFSTDLKNGFFSISIKHSDRHLTSFIVNEKQYQYNRLAQGMSSSPAIFQKFTRHIFSDEYFAKFKDRFVLKLYMDDILCVCVQKYQTFAVEKVFERCLEHHILVGLEKTFFFQKSIDFLGYTLTADGLRVPDSRLKSIFELDYPKTTKQAQKLVGSLIYYARILPRVTQLLAPITDAISQETFVLTENMKLGLDKLKRLIKEKSSGDHLDYDLSENKYLFLATDAALAGVGMALGSCQYDGSEVSNVRISHFGSKKLEKNVQLLSSRCRELIGISLGLIEFEDLLDLNLPFLIFTDHKSVARIKDNDTVARNSVGTRVRKALSIILEYTQAKIVYISADHFILKIVDGLSRLPSVTVTENSKILETDLLGSASVNNISVTSGLLEKEKILKLQREDGYILRFFEDIKASKFPIIFQGRKYILRNGLVYLVTNNCLELLLIPDSAANEIVQFVHFELVHPGEKRLLRVLRDSPIFIRKLSSVVHSVTKNCLFCQFSHKGRNFRKTNESHAVHRPALSPFLEVSVDLMSINYGAKNLYILTFIDKFSLFLDFEFVKSKSADQICKVLSILLLKWNCSIRSCVTSDNGTEFSNLAVKTLLQNMGIGHSFSSPYNSKGQVVERSHKDLRALSISLGADAKNYKYVIKLAVARYNSLPKKSLDYLSPLQVLTGLNPRPIITLKNEPIVDSSSEINDEFRPYEWLDYLEMLQFETSYFKFENFQTRSSDTPKFEIGDFVICREPKIQLSKIVNPQASGPYVVVGRYRNAYKLRHKITDLRIIRNGRFLRALHLSDADKQRLENLDAENAPPFVWPSSVENRSIYTRLPIIEDQSVTGITRSSLRPRTGKKS